jgi:hypothetical protein
MSDERLTVNVIELHTQIGRTLASYSRDQRVRSQP